LQENQNTNEQEQSNKVIPAEVQEGSAPAASETSAHAITEIKEEAPTLSTQPQTSPDSHRDQPQTETMEVHKHPHHVTHKKKWGEYLLEFLMIFFAVFLGFLAENLREGIKNKEEIHSDMQSIVADLKSDVVYFDSLIIRNEYSCRMTDSLISLLANQPSNTADIYYLARTITANFGYFYSNAKTFEQMKASGNLKLIKPRSLLDSIANYYASFQWFTNQAELVLSKIDEIHQNNSKLFNAFIFQKMMHIDYGNFQRGIISIRKPEVNPAFLTSDAAVINDVAIGYHYFFSTMKFYDKTGAQLLTQARRLIDLIEKEYNSH
jgi:hypothetical protein